MSCLCGDIQCNSCGPAQGNFRCMICHSWFDDGCIHLNEDGMVKEEFQEEAARIDETNRQADDQYASDLEKEADLAEQYRKDYE